MFFKNYTLENVYWRKNSKEQSIQRNFMLKNACSHEFQQQWGYLNTKI